MRKTYLLALIVLLAPASLLAGTYNIATYNIRQKNKGDVRNGNGWETRAPVVPSLIKFHDFDIFGVQEAFEEQLRDLHELDGLRRKRALIKIIGE
jgi:hypothetical protein